VDGNRRVGTAGWQQTIEHFGQVLPQARLKLDDADRPRAADDDEVNQTGTHL
jgi:hypothetical protein